MQFAKWKKRGNWGIFDDKIDLGAGFRQTERIYEYLPRWKEVGKKRSFYFSCFVF